MKAFDDPQQFWFWTHRNTSKAVRADRLVQHSILELHAPELESLGHPGWMPDPEWRILGKPADYGARDPLALKGFMEGGDITYPALRPRGGRRDRMAVQPECALL